MKCVELMRRCVVVAVSIGASGCMQSGLGLPRGPLPERVVVETGRCACNGRVSRIRGSVYWRDRQDDAGAIIRLVEGEQVATNTVLFRYDGNSYVMVRCDVSKELKVVEFEYDRTLPGKERRASDADLRMEGPPGRRFPTSPRLPLTEPSQRLAESTTSENRRVARRFRK